MMKAFRQIFQRLEFAQGSFVGASLLAAQRVRCREQARSHSRSPKPLFVAWVLALFIGLLSVSPLAAAAPAPQVSVSLRGVEAQTVGQGEPWRVMVRIDLPRGSKGTVELAPASGTWADAVAVELYPEAGTAVAARAEAVGKPDTAAATLDAKHIAGGLWRFSPEMMQAVAPGSYRLLVQLKIESGSGWKGVAAREIPLTVVASTPKSSVSKITNRAQDLLLIGKVREAAATVDAELKNAPRDYALLKVRALIAEKAGNPFAAIMCLNAANFSAAKKTTGQPPVEDGEMLARLEKARKTAPTNPPAWTWPPAEVLLAFTEEAKKSGFVSTTYSARAPETRSEPAPSAPASAQSQFAIPTAPAPAATQNPAAPKPATPFAATNAATPGSAAPVGPIPGVIVPSAELSDAKITADATGQWAVSAMAGSQYDKKQYSAAQATGAPNVSVAGNSPDAWCPAGKNTGTDWLELSFAKSVNATEVRVRQNDTVGAIAKIEAIEPDGTPHIWWEGIDPYKAPAVRDIVWFAVRVPATSYLVAKVKITLNLAAVTGWKQIDAVQLVAEVP